MTAAEYAAGLREFADWIEEHGEAMHLLEERLHLLSCVATPEKFVARARLMGAGEKSSDENYFEFSRTFGPVKVKLFARHENVCTKTVTVKEVDVVEWECPSILADAPEAVPA